MAEVMVVDRLSDKLGDGVEKRKYIVAGDLSQATIRQILNCYFVETNQVCECYFDDFFEDAPKVQAQKQQKKEIAKILAPLDDTPNPDAEIPAEKEEPVSSQ